MLAPIMRLLLYYWITTLCQTIVTPCYSLDLFRQYPTFPNHAARPKFTVQPEDQTAELGSRVQLKCSGEASPNPILFWYKEGHRQLMFPPSTAAGYSPSTRLHAAESQSLWPQQAALVGSTEHGLAPASDTSPSINKLFTMPADQISSPSYGNNYFGNRIYVDNQGNLNIVNVTISDNGYYACALISSVGSVMAKAKLTVKRSINGPLSTSDYYEPSSLYDPIHSDASYSSASKFELLPPPVIRLGAANQTLPTNTSTNLICEVVSQVPYKVQWFFESDPVRNDPPRVVVLDSGTLSISNLRASDSGLYTCVVTAANDNMNLPVASPFEPLDSSMLTTAPPIQQTTSHTTLLKVASPMNPNIQFFKMDTYAFPSSPGPAQLVSHNGNDAITISWSAPADSGTLPIKEYIVEHYDTSQEHLGWRVIYRIKGKESLLIDGLSADGSHFFVIRAANSHGVGPSSAISVPMRTIAGEQRFQAELQRRRLPSDLIKSNPDMLTGTSRADINAARDKLMAITTNLLGLTPVSSTSIRLQWSTQNSARSSGFSNPESLGALPLEPSEVGDFLEGYSIRYRAIGMGETHLGKAPLSVANLNNWHSRDSPSSLPLVTSFIDESEDTLLRSKRDLGSFFDYSQEFNELRVVDHRTEQYTINGLRPFTLYQFFVVPYYKDIDGVPSNILTAQTNEDRPSVAPPNLTVRPVNNSSVRLIWSHVPPLYANGILRGYAVRLNRTDVITRSDQLSQQMTTEPPKILSLSLGMLNVAPLTPYAPDTRTQSSVNGNQQYVVMYELTNLTYKSFYSVQVAASTSVGAGPWTESQNFIMDPKVLSQSREQGGEFEDVLSKSFLSTNPRTYGSSNGHSSSGVYLMICVGFVIVTIILVAGYLLYRRNNQKVITWKKTISEHFTNKFYMPSTVDHRGPGSMQQNIYDHQQHLIYSGPTHMTQQSIPSHTMWAPNGCVNSSGAGSLSSHGGMVPIINGPGGVTRQVNGEQVLLMNGKDMNARFAKNSPGQLLNQQGVDPTRMVANQGQLTHQGDYYSVINNMAEYEELDPQRQGNKQASANADRHQTASSNSDTSCPSSVTRLLPNQQLNKDLLNKTLNENVRHEMVLQQQQINYHDGKQPFATIINQDANKVQSMMPLSPYATTNLMNQAQMSQQLFGNTPMGMVDGSRQSNFALVHNNAIGFGGGMTMDDSSRILISQQGQGGMVPNQMSVFRTMQRAPSNFQRGQQFAQVQSPLMMQPDIGRTQIHNQPNYGHGGQQFSQSSVMTNITTNPMVDNRSNLYEHIEYSDPSGQSQHPNQGVHRFQSYNTQVSNDLISSSTSSGSMKSSPDQHQNGVSSKFRRGSSNANPTPNEAHDLHVFSSVQGSQPSGVRTSAELERLNSCEHSDGNKCDNGNGDEDDGSQVDETTSFRQKSFNKDDSQRSRQMSKRKRQQQRNRLHNNNQQLG